MNYKKILQQAIDLHVHVGPENIPRRYTVAALAQAEKGKLAGVGVKNHYFPTVFAKPLKKTGLKIVYGITLNNSLGGFNAAAIQSTADLAKGPVIVWFPTISAQNFLSQQDYEIPPEWLPRNTRTQSFKKSKKAGLTIFNNNGSIRADVLEVLQTIKKTGAILATGHLSWQESQALIRIAVSMGIKKMVITHPIYQKIAMPIAIQKEVSTLGAFIEQSYSMYAIDKIPIAAIADQIKYVGAQNCILTSDVGQVFSPSPSVALKKFAQLLIKAGLKQADIRTMLIKNPRKLIRKNNKL